jgi:hypothetical protein
MWCFVRLHICWNCYRPKIVIFSSQLVAIPCAYRENITWKSITFISNNITCSSPFVYIARAVRVHCLMFKAIVLNTNICHDLNACYECLLVSDTTVWLNNPDVILSSDTTLLYVLYMLFISNVLLFDRRNKSFIRSNTLCPHNVIVLYWASWGLIKHKS